MNNEFFIINWRLEINVPMTPDASIPYIPIKEHLFIII